MLKKEQIDFIESVLSSEEKELVKTFVENTKQFDAVKKILLSGVYSDGVMHQEKPADALQNFVLGTMSHPLMVNAPMAEKGMKMTAILDAVGMVESGFESLLHFKQVEPEIIEKVNKAK